MNIESVPTILFYLFGGLSVCLALCVVMAKRVLRAVICLMGVLIVSAGFYLMLGSEFLAGVQLLVYVGGIVVLLVFVIMLTGAGNHVDPKPTFLRKLTSFFVVITFLGWSTLALLTTTFPQKTSSPPRSEAKALGIKLLDYGPEGYILPFEVISLLLLSVLIGGIVIARKTGESK